MSWATDTWADGAQADAKHKAEAAVAETQSTFENSQLNYTSSVSTTPFGASPQSPQPARVPSAPFAQPAHAVPVTVIGSATPPATAVQAHPARQNAVPTASPVGNLTPMAPAPFTPAYPVTPTYPTSFGTAMPTVGSEVPRFVSRSSLPSPIPTGCRTPLPPVDAQPQPVPSWGHATPTHPVGSRDLSASGDFELVQVPRVHVVEKIVEVPQRQLVTKVLEVPEVQVQEVIKHVPKPEIQYVQHYVEVPDVQWVTKHVEVPQVQQQEIIRHVPRVEVQEVYKCVPRHMVQYVERVVEVPQPVPTVEVVRHVPRIETQEVLQHVRRPQVHYVEKVVEVPQVQHVPQVVAVAKPEYREVIHHVLRPEIQYVEKVVEVPRVQTVERLVEVPEVHVEEILRHVPRYEMETMQVPRGMPVSGMVASSSSSTLRHPAPGPASPMRTAGLLPGPVPAQATLAASMPTQPVLLAQPSMLAQPMLPAPLSQPMLPVPLPAMAGTSPFFGGLDGSHDAFAGSAAFGISRPY